MCVLSTITITHTHTSPNFFIQNNFANNLFLWVLPFIFNNGAYKIWILKKHPAHEIRLREEYPNYL